MCITILYYTSPRTPDEFYNNNIIYYTFFSDRPVPGLYLLPDNNIYHYSCVRALPAAVRFFRLRASYVLLIVSCSIEIRRRRVNHETRANYNIIICDRHFCFFLFFFYHVVLYSTVTNNIFLLIKHYFI